MGTRTVIEFCDQRAAYSVYKHWDGNPSNIVRLVREALAYAWVLPRFEASEFACAFIRAAKDLEGDVYLSKGADFHGDLDYTYSVYMMGNQLYIECRRVSDDSQLFCLPLTDVLLEGLS